MSEERKTGLAGERHHRFVGTQGIPEQSRGAESRGAALQIREQSGTNALALPAVVNRQAELETFRIRIERVARFADESLHPFAGRYGCDQAEAVVFSDVDELIQRGLRQFADRAQELVVTRARAERPEI